jgi:hypothetical protein
VIISIFFLGGSISQDSKGIQWHGTSASASLGVC